MVKKKNDAEIAIIPADRITSELIKANVTEETLKAMEETFMTLKINGLTDKEGLEQVYKSRIQCKNTRILTEKICKQGRESAIAEQKAWIAKEKEITGRIATVEDYLQAQEDVIENEKKRIKEEKEKQEQIRIQNRTAELLKYGMSFNGEQYSLGEVIITATEVKLFDDFTYNTFLSKIELAYKAELARKEEKNRVAKEKAELFAEEHEKLRKEREEFETQKKEQEEKIKAEKEKAEAEQKIIAEEQKKLQEERKKEEDNRIKQRSSVLYGLGMSFTGEKYVFNGIEISLEDVKTKPAEEFEELVRVFLTPKITEKKEELEKQRLAEIEKTKEKTRLETEEKLKKEAEEKQIAEANKIAEEARVAALKPDKEKLAILSVTVATIVLPELTSESGKIKMEEIKVQFSKMVEYLKKAGEGLV